jgi:RimJ/RimL family protein N-acetyltransferase
VRIQKEKEINALIGLSVDSVHRGKGYAKEMLQAASDFFLKENPHFCIDAYIKEQNLNSKVAFEKAGFRFLGMMIYEGYKSFHYIKKTNENR